MLPSNVGTANGGEVLLDSNLQPSRLSVICAQTC